ncbi:hypothetical protein ACFPVX_13190 [Cohnella faecalis]|uniref:Uncharacterized protein n=1 Tax=Cohnella faecalis TaxID=2315694 RepID=A0A398CS42_9BACL|nr:hypothetical protein [Cohnella faecalis]RIE02617.1 hypothetical protein D3H35_18215 [Cohnella faecalis]
MTIKYRIACPGSDIYVLEKEDGFHLTVSSRTNPLSFGSKVAAFHSLGNAVEAAESFHVVFTLSKEYGYHLDQNQLKKDGLQALSVLELLESPRSSTDLRDMFEREKAVVRE